MPVQDERVELRMCQPADEATCTGEHSNEAGVQSSFEGSGAGTKAEYLPKETLLPGMFTISAIFPFLARKLWEFLFSIFIIIENNERGY